MPKKTEASKNPASNNISEVANKVVALLDPLSSEERQRVVRAVLTLLGEDTRTVQLAKSDSVRNETQGAPGGLPRKVQLWLKQYNVSEEELEQVFHVTSDRVEVIASDFPGNNKRAKTVSAYLLAGIGKFLETGDAKVDDEVARTLCQTTGCYDRTNHAKALKHLGNVLTGTKGGGWIVTGPGLKRGAEIVKELAAKQ